jgi:hypothetical protein
MEPCSLSRRSPRPAWMCAECRHPRRGTESVSVVIQNPVPADAPLNYISGCGIRIARREFLASLGDAVQRNLYLGTVTSDTGAQLQDWVTYRGRHEVIIRGDLHVAFRNCRSCGRLLYSAMGARYLYPAPIAEAQILEPDGAGVVLTDTLLSRVDLARWPALTVDDLVVRDPPTDGAAHLRSVFDPCGAPRSPNAWRPGQQ